MRPEEADERVEVQRLDGSTGARILQCVPRLRPAQDERTAARVLEVIGILRCSERHLERSLPGDVVFRPRGPAEASGGKTGESKIGIGAAALASFASKKLPNPRRSEER